MKVYQLICKLMSMPMTAEVRFVKDGATKTLKQVYLSDRGQVVLGESSFYLSDRADMPRDPQA